MSIAGVIPRNSASDRGRICLRELDAPQELRRERAAQRRCGQLVGPRDHGHRRDHSHRGAREREGAPWKNPTIAGRSSESAAARCADICRAIEQRSVRRRIGTAEPGPVHGDQPRAQALERARGEPERTTRRRARREQYRRAVRGPHSDTPSAAPAPRGPRRAAPASIRPAA